MGSGCRRYSKWKEKFQVLCLLVMLFQRARSWLLYFLVWQIHSKGAVGRKHLWRGHMSDKVPEERNEELWPSTTNQWSSVRNMFFAPNPQFTLHCTLGRVSNRGAFFAWRAPILSRPRIMCSQVRMLKFLEPSREMTQHSQVHPPRGQDCSPPAQGVESPVQGGCHSYKRSRRRRSGRRCL